MNFEPNLAEALVEDILDAVYKYHDTITLITAVGCLELAKAELLEAQRAINEDEDED